MMPLGCTPHALSQAQRLLGMNMPAGMLELTGGRASWQAIAPTTSSLTLQHL